MSTVFITGTDTEVGKTYVTAMLLRAAREQGLNWAGFKPVSAGAEITSEGLRNADALALQAAANSNIPYASLNPYCFEAPIAPHIAAERAGSCMDWATVLAAHRELSSVYDVILAEGAGGWLVPFNAQSTVADHIANMEWPVVMVVGMRLGCINHALLVAESIQRRCRLLGWVANCLPPQQDMLAENIATLRQRLAAPLLGKVESGSDSGAELLGNLRAELASR